MAFHTAFRISETYQLSLVCLWGEFNSHDFPKVNLYDTWMQNNPSWTQRGETGLTFPPESEPQRSLEGHKDQIEDIGLFNGWGNCKRDESLSHLGSVISANKRGITSVSLIQRNPYCEQGNNVSKCLPGPMKPHWSWAKSLPYTKRNSECSQCKWAAWAVLHPLA